MPQLFKPSRNYPLPANADVVTHQGRQCLRVQANGKTVFYPLSDDGRHYKKTSPKYAADVVNAHGKRQRHFFATTHAASLTMLAKLLEQIQNEKLGIKPVGQLLRRPLAELLQEYREHQFSKDITRDEAILSVRRCEMVFEGCGFVVLGDLDAGQVNQWLAKRRSMPKHKGGIGARTSNHFVTMLNRFMNWAIRHDKALSNPFKHLNRANVATDIRRPRRPLDTAEFVRLLQAAESGKTFRHLSGPDRRMLYLVASLTGLRASELASLTPASFNLEAETPTFTVEAAYAKNGRRDCLPLHLALADELRPWLEGRSGLLWPGNWAKNHEGCDLMKHDLKAARTKWISEANSAEDQAKREASDFLLYRNHKGEAADFHGNRARFITELVNAGAMPEQAKQLARHSTIMLTMDVYHRATMQHAAAALERLPAHESLGKRDEPCAALCAADVEEVVGKLVRTEEPSECGGMNAAEMQTLVSKGFEEDLATPKKVEKVPPMRFERMTPGLGNQCSIP